MIKSPSALTSSRRQLTSSRRSLVSSCHQIHCWVAVYWRLWHKCSCISDNYIICCPYFFFHSTSTRPPDSLWDTSASDMLQLLLYLKLVLPLLRHHSFPWIKNQSLAGALKPALNCQRKCSVPTLSSPAHFVLNRIRETSADLDIACLWTLPLSQDTSYQKGCKIYLCLQKVSSHSAWIENN